MAFQTQVCTTKWIWSKKTRFAKLHHYIWLLQPSATEAAEAASPSAHSATIPHCQLACWTAFSDSFSTNFKCYSARRRGAVDGGGTELRILVVIISALLLLPLELPPVKTLPDCAAPQQLVVHNYSSSQSRCSMHSRKNHNFPALGWMSSWLKCFTI